MGEKETVEDMNHDHFYPSSPFGQVRYTNDMRNSRKKEQRLVNSTHIPPPSPSLPLIQFISNTLSSLSIAESNNEEKKKRDS